MSLFSSSRRGFLRRSGVLLLGCLAASGFRARRALGSDRLAFLQTCSLDPILNDPEIARRIGEEYLREHPWEARHELLEQHLLPDMDGWTVHGAQQRLEEARAMDFEQGDILVADGWVLARTEARVCGLRVLLSAQAAAAV